MKDIDWFLSICAANGLSLTPEQAVRFEKYREALLAANRQVNLISRKDEDNFYPNHALNSVSFLFGRKLKPDAKMLDLGTGGGLPGIPVKIIYSGIGMALLDSITKKTAALSSILTELGLGEMEIINARAEEVSKRDEFQGHFHYVISRAAGKLEDVVKWSHKFLKSSEEASDDSLPVGTLIVLKGGSFDEELRHAKSLKSVKSVEVADVTFQGMDEVYNKEKKLVLVKYKEASFGRKN